MPTYSIDPAFTALVEQLVDEKIEARLQRTDGYMNAETAARYLDAPPSRVYDLAATGRLRVVRDGRRLLTRREWLDDVLTEASR
jgi:excisionase family DNA binding protein